MHATETRITPYETSDGLASLLQLRALSCNQSPLLSLPSDMIKSIVQFADGTDLIMLLLTCRDPRLFHHLTVRTEPGFRMERTTKISIPSHHKSIKSLRIGTFDFVWSTSWSRSIEHLSMTNMKVVDASTASTLGCVTLLYEPLFFRMLPAPYLQALKSLKAPYCSSSLSLWRAKINIDTLEHLDIMRCDIFDHDFIRLIGSFLNLKRLILQDPNFGYESDDYLAETVTKNLLREQAALKTPQFQKLQYLKLTFGYDDSMLEQDTFAALINWIMSGKAPRLDISLPHETDMSDLMLEHVKHLTVYQLCQGESLESLAELLENKCLSLISLTISKCSESGLCLRCKPIFSRIKRQIPDARLHFEPYEDVGCDAL